MSNFTFLQNEWPELYQSARRVERYVQSDPRSACFYARRALELGVQWLYDHDRAFRYPYDDNLAALLNEASFRDNVPPAIYTKAQLLRKTGNLAVHSRKRIPERAALGTAIELRHVLYWLARTYTQGDPNGITDRFAVMGNMGWMSANVDEWDGSFSYIHLRTHFRLFENVGLALGYQFTDVDVSRERRRESSLYDIEFSGPSAMLTVSF